MMQNPDDVDAAGAFDVERRVAANAIPPIADADLVAGAPATRIVGDTFNRRPDLCHICLCLADVPALLGGVPDRREVALRGWGETVVAHDFFAAMKASKSNSSGTPLSSPATRAARRAPKRVSWSSRSRRPARMTSLAER